MIVQRRIEYLIGSIIFISGGIYGVARGLYFALSGTLVSPDVGELISLVISLGALIIGYTFLVFSRMKAIDTHHRGSSTLEPRKRP